MIIKFFIPALPSTYILEAEAELVKCASDINRTPVIGWAMGSENEVYPVTVADGPIDRANVPVLYPDGSVDAGDNLATDLDDVAARAEAFFPKR